MTVRRCAAAPKTSAEGTLVYLAVTPTLDSALDRLAAAGGKLATPKVTLPGEAGVFAHIVDSEGNRVGPSLARRWPTLLRAAESQERGRGRRSSRSKTIGG